MIAMPSPSPGPEAPVAPQRMPNLRENFVECPVCAFELPGELSIPRRRCPKCHSSSWRLVSRPVVEALTLASGD
jgi:hypothetical protein